MSEPTKDTRATMGNRWREISRDWLRDIATATGFLTRLPVVLPVPVMDRAPRAFPIVGALVGAVGAGFMALALAWGLPQLVASLAALAAMVLVTGGLHEDGLADMADGFGGGKTIDDKLRIMRDSAIGAYGVLALVLSLALRAALLAATLDRAGALVAAMLLVASGAMSRALVVAGLAWLVPARADGLGHALARPGAMGLYTALGIGGAISTLLVWPIAGSGGLFRIVVGAILGGGGVYWLANHQIKGQTGDVNGSAIICAEIGIFAAILPAL